MREYQEGGRTDCSADQQTGQDEDGDQDSAPMAGLESVERGLGVARKYHCLGRFKAIY
jgi:hypothetical protein